MTEYKMVLTAENKAVATANMGVKRGSETWNYIYIMLGFALAIVSSAIGMVPYFPYNLIAFIVIAFILICLFLGNKWFQNKLVVIKNAYENKMR